MPIRHAFTSAKSDSADATLVRPSDWNADHTGGVEAFNVKDYGALGDGNADDTDAIQDALDAAMAADPHATIYIPAGNYMIHGPLTIAVNDDVYIQGAGKGLTRLNGWNGTDITILSLTADGPGTTGVRVVIRDLSIEQHASATRCVCLSVIDYAQVTLENLYLLGSSNTLTLKGVANFHGINIFSQTSGNNAAGNSGVLLDRDASNVACGPGEFTGCQFGGYAAVTTGAAVKSNGSFAVSFIGTMVQGFAAALVSVVELNDDDTSWISTYTESSYNTGADTACLFRIGGTSVSIAFSMIGGHFYSGNGTRNLQDGIRVMSTGVQKMTVHDTQWSNYVRSGVRIDTASVILAGTFLNNEISSGTFFSDAGGIAPAASRIAAYFIGTTYANTLSLGQNTATTGDLRLKNGTFIQARNNANNANGGLIGMGVGDDVIIDSDGFGAQALSTFTVGGVFTASAAQTLTGITTHSNKVQLATGTTAIAPLKFAAGTNLTTAEAGALEMDATNIYGTTDAGNRGYIPIRHFIRNNATRALPNDTNLNALFNSPTNGRLTLEAGTYLFEMMFRITGMSATSGNALINLVGAGTATTGGYLWWYHGLDVTEPTTVVAMLSANPITTATAASAFTATTGTAMFMVAQGSFEVSVAGTFIPSIDLVTATAGTVAIGSYFMCERMGTENVVSVGQWD